MITDAEYHEMRSAQERAIASSLVEGEARERHRALADRHADRAWLIRHGYVGDPALVAIEQPDHRGRADNSLSQAIARSRELLAQSHRILSESRRDVPPRT